MGDVLLVEGWRFIAHSYAVVNQWQLIALSRREGFGLRHRDVPFFSPNWKQASGLMSAAQEDVLRAIPEPSGTDRIIARYRIRFPLDVSIAGDEPHFVFGTCEVKTFNPVNIVGLQDSIADLARRDNFYLVTPSLWSKEGFVRLGLRDDQVLVIPHGFSPDVFRPADDAAREALRRPRGLDGFLFVNVSAVLPNKGCDVLVRAFARVLRRHPECRLLLKGSDKMYDSGNSLAAIIQQLPPHEQALVLQRLVYIGGEIPAADLVQMYQCADAYVSPFRAEGFNLPVMEAAACGVPVIYTSGGAPDEFMDARQHTPVASKLCTYPTETFLEPDLDDLVDRMIECVEQAGQKRAQALVYSRALAQTHSWERVAETLARTIEERRI